ENFYCDNKLFNFCRYEKPTQSRIDLVEYGEHMYKAEDNPTRFPEMDPLDIAFHEADSTLINKAKSFLYTCEMIRNNQDYIDSHSTLYSSERLEHLNMAMNRARHTALHQILSDFFRVEINISIPERYERSWDQQCF